MRFSLNWLSEYVTLSKSKESLAELINEFSFEVEAVEKYGQDLDSRIIVAEVLSVGKHPNAHKLSVVALKTGSRTVEPVVCGAKNFKVGDKVALALSGALIPHNEHDPEGKPF